MASITIHPKAKYALIIALFVIAIISYYVSYAGPRQLPALFSSATTNVYDYSQYVNPFIGSEGAIEGLAYGGGQIFVGGAVPFGVAKVGIDTFEPDRRLSRINGGYTPKGSVTGVTMMHESGTGGPPKYGIIHSMPLSTLDGVNILDNTTYWQERVGDDVATVGYFSTKMKNGVGIKLAGARHSGVFEYDYPTDEKYVLVDVSHYLPEEKASRRSGQYYAGGEIHLESGGRVYKGWGSYGGGFSNSAPMTTYFCGEFERSPDVAQAFRGCNTDPVVSQHSCASGEIPLPTWGDDHEESGPMNDRVGALFQWSDLDDAPVRSRVGISMISVEKACKFKEDEIRSWDLNDTIQAAVNEWNMDVFSKIQVPVDESQNRTELVLVYSSLYFMHLMPSDRTGENPLWPSEDSWDDFYAIWDIFRNTVSLYHLLQPIYYASMIRSLIEIWKWDGFMPDGRSGNYNGLVQGGSDADNVLADAYIKNLPGVNWTEAYQAMLKDATVVPYNQFNPIDLTGDIQQGRGALSEWINLGYIAVDRNSRSISRTIEYSSNDYSLAVVAQGLGKKDDHELYLKRSAQWQNLWAHDFEYKGFKGFMAPRLRNGRWRDLDEYNPAKCDKGCGWADTTYEGTPFEYSFTVPHDMETLVDFMGGPDEFERRLDYIFEPNTTEQDHGGNGLGINTIMNIGNEPDFATPYEYNYINKQYKSVEKSRMLANKYFHDAPYGVPGNSDAGALNSWLIWQMLGLYPVATQTVYLIGSPWFSEVNMTIGDGKFLTIRANNLDNQNRYYVQSVKVNGQPWDKNWLDHEDVMVDGGTIEFDMGNRQRRWESGDVPPSPGHLIL